MMNTEPIDLCRSSLTEDVNYFISTLLRWPIPVDYFVGLEICPVPVSQQLNIAGSRRSWTRPSRWARRRPWRGRAGRCARGPATPRCTARRRCGCSPAALASSSRRGRSGTSRRPIATVRKSASCPNSVKVHVCKHRVINTTIRCLNYS